MCTEAHERAIRDLAEGKSDDDGINFALLREAVIAEINRKIGSKRCDVWSFLRDSCRYSDAQIWRYLWQEDPPTCQDADQPRETMPMIQAYAEMITAELCRNGTRCSCAERYQSYSRKGERYKKYAEMQKACERNHQIVAFRADPRFSEAVGALEWLKKAVHGASNLLFQVGNGKRASGMYRAFGNSMLCAVLRTPDETSLYLVPARNLPAALREDGISPDADVLVDSRWLESQENDDVGGLNAIDESVGDVLAIWYCVTCDRFVHHQQGCGGTCDCHWELHEVVQDDPTGAATDPFPAPEKMKKKTLNICANRHFWPSVKTDQCPVPGCGETAMDKITVTLLPHPIGEH